MAYLANLVYRCRWFNKDSQVNPFYSRQLLKMGSIFASLHTKATIWDYQKITEQLPPPQWWCKETGTSIFFNVTPHTYSVKWNHLSPALKMKQVVLSKPIYLIVPSGIVVLKSTSHHTVGYLFQNQTNTSLRQCVFFRKKNADTYRPKYKGHKTYKRTQAKSYVVVYRVRILKHTLKNNSGKFFYSMRNGTTSKLWKWIKTVMVKLLPVVSEITKVDQFQFTLSFNFLVTDRIWMGELESLGEPWVCVQNRGSWRINNPKVEGLMEARTQYKSSLD